MKKLEYPDFSKVPTVQDQIEGIKAMNERIKSPMKTFQGTFSKNGKPQWVDPAGVIEAMRFDGEGAIHIEQYGVNKTVYMQGYFEGVLVPSVLECLRNAGESAICTKNDARAWIKQTFFLRNTFMVNGRLFYDTYSLSNVDWTKKEFSDKMEYIWQFFIENYDWTIPPPDPKKRSKK
jgi:serine protease inhibitor